MSAKQLLLNETSPKALLPRAQPSELTTAPPPQPSPDEIKTDNKAKKRAALAYEVLAYRIDDAVVITGLSRSTLYALIADGKLATVKVGGRRLVLKAGIEELLRGAA